MPGKKEVQSVIDTRLESTLDLFAPTAQQAPTAAPAEAEPQEGESDQVAAETKQAGKSRKFEMDTPAFRLRIRPEDNDRLGKLADDLGVSRDDVARALVQAALDALDDGHLTLKMDQEVIVKRDVRERKRRSVIAVARVAWTCERKKK